MKIKKLSQTRKISKSPLRSPQGIDSTMKIYQQLETQIKGILRKKDSLTKTLKVPRRYENYKSERVSPIHTPMTNPL